MKYKDYNVTIFVFISIYSNININRMVIIVTTIAALQRIFPITTTE